MSYPGMVPAAVIPTTTVTQAVTATLADGESATRTFLGFVPGTNGIPLGVTLRGVTETLIDSMDGTITVTNLGTEPGTFNVALLHEVTKTLVPGFVLTDTISGNAVEGVLAGGATVTLASGGHHTLSLSSADPDVLQAFSSSIVSEFIATSLSRTLTIGFANTEIDGASVTLTESLTYAFSTAPRVPEPATFSVLGSGLIGLGLARLARRRRKR